jgi:hypothetical protein
MLEILPDIEILLPDARNITGCDITKDRQVRFAEPTKQDQRAAPRVQNGIEVPRVKNGIFPTDRQAPITMVSGRAWSPGIYQSLTPVLLVFFRQYLVDILIGAIAQISHD